MGVCPAVGVDGSVDTGVGVKTDCVGETIGRSCEEVLLLHPINAIQHPIVKVSKLSILDQ